MRTDVTLAALVLALAGCGGDDRQSASPGPAATSDTTAAVPEPLQGKFTRDVSPADNKAAGEVYGSPPAGIPLGTATLVVEPDGVVFTTHGDGGDEELTFDVTGDRMKVTGGAYCDDPAASSTYRWSRSGDSLVITPIDNDCPDRQALLAGTWRTA